MPGHGVSLLGQPCARPQHFSPGQPCARPQRFSPGQPCARLQGFFSRLALFDACCFPLEMFHVLITLACWDLNCCFGFTLAVHTTLTGTLPSGTLPSQGCTQGSWPCRALSSLHVFPFKSGWKLPWSCSSCFLHPCKISTMWMMPRSAASLMAARSSWTLNAWVGSLCKKGALGCFVSRESLSVACSFIPVDWWDLASSRDALKVPSFIPLKSKAFRVA